MTVRSFPDTSSLSAEASGEAWRHPRASAEHRRANRSVRLSRRGLDRVLVLSWLAVGGGKRGEEIPHIELAHLRFERVKAAGNDRDERGRVEWIERRERVVGRRNEQRKIECDGETQQTNEHQVSHAQTLPPRSRRRGPGGTPRGDFCHPRERAPDVNHKLWISFRRADERRVPQAACGRCERQVRNGSADVEEEWRDAEKLAAKKSSAEGVLDAHACRPHGRFAVPARDLEAGNYQETVVAKIGIAAERGPAFPFLPSPTRELPVPLVQPNFE